MVKCFWCGTPNPRGETVCAQCKRELQWSRFLRAVSRPAADSPHESVVVPIRAGARRLGAAAGS